MPQAKSQGKKIERTSDVAWWCPVCDHSNEDRQVCCGGCGAERKGDKVTS